MSKPGNVLSLIDGLYGSCGKGVIASHLAPDYDVHVRVGSVQAGHTHHSERHGRNFVQQVVPVGWVNRNATLIIGRGSLLSMEQLVKEVEEIRQYDESILDRLVIDSRAGVHSQSHHDAEGGTGGELHRRIGSTGEGVGAARISRLRRDPEQFKLARDVAHDFGGSDWSVADLLKDDVHRLILDRRDLGVDVLLEGAQGCGLDLIHGPWPFVTTNGCGTAQLAADIGIPPRFVNRTMMVVRSHPIRVAGNSGPMYKETTWEELSSRLGRPVRETTTVTKKVRRVGEWDDQLFMDSFSREHPTSIALTFADYIESSDEGKTVFNELSDRTRAFSAYLESVTGVPVVLIGTGGPTFSIVDVGGRP